MAVLKGAASITDPNPVDPEHVANQLRGNFPEDALQWVFHGHWIGPVAIPWSRINTGSIGTWAASHQPGAVARFKRKIIARKGKVKPSVLIQGHDGDRCDVIDGHHRAIAHHELGRPVRAYVGTIHGQKWVQQALEAHSAQEHSGSSPQNKSAETPELAVHHAPIGHEGIWHSEHPPLEYPPYYQNVRNALIRAGHSEGEAHAIALNALRRWASGGGNVHPEVRQAAQAALAEYDKERANHP